MYVPVAERLSAEVLNKAFLIALLLAGSVERAEAAVMEGIRQLDDRVDLLETAMIAAIGASADTGGSAQALLPDELRRVLDLPEVRPPLLRIALAHGITTSLLRAYPSHGSRPCRRSSLRGSMYVGPDGGKGGLALAVPGATRVHYRSGDQT
jgi:hypothetical protein